jgi:hypothetical protein
MATDSATFNIIEKFEFLKMILSMIDNPYFKGYVANTVSNLFLDKRDRTDIVLLIDYFERDVNGEKLTVKLNSVFHLYCIVFRFIKEHHSIVEPRFHRFLEDFEEDVTNGKQTEQEYIDYCSEIQEMKEFVDEVSLVYRDNTNIYFIADPDDADGLTIAINGLPRGDNLVKYMFNYDMERDRCIALKVKQAEAERKAKQAKDDEELIQAFQEQKTKEKKQSIQDLTRQANKKRAKEQQLRKEFEKSAAAKELEKAKDKKKKQQKKSSSA